MKQKAFPLPVFYLIIQRSLAEEIGKFHLPKDYILLHIVAGVLNLIEYQTTVTFILVQYIYYCPYSNIPYRHVGTMTSSHQGIVIN